jgi:hypothetical protein
MKQTISFIVIALGLHMVSCCPGKTVYSGTTTADTVYPVNNLLAKIREQYGMARLRFNDTSHLKVSQVDVVFDVTNTSILKGGLGVLVVKAEATHATSKESTITFTLADTTTPLIHALTVAPGSNVLDQKENELAKLILNTYNQFLSIKTGIAKTTPTQFEIDIQFSVETDGNLDISGPLGIFTPEGYYEKDHKTLNIIRMTFVAI